MSADVLERSAACLACVGQPVRVRIGGQLGVTDIRMPQGNRAMAGVIHSKMSGVIASSLGAGRTARC